MQREIKHERPLPTGRCGHVPRHYTDDRLGTTHIIECARGDL